MSTDYESTGYGSSESPPPPRSPSRRRWLIPVLAALALLFLLTSIALAIFRDNDTDPKPIPTPRPVHHTPTSTPTPAHYRPTSTPAPTATPLPCNPKIESAILPKPVHVSVPSGPDGAIPSRQQLARAFASLVRGNHGNNHAAIVLTFGHPTSYSKGLPSAITDANSRAHQVNQLLKSMFPGLFRTATIRDYHNLSGVDGRVDFEIYLWRPNCAPIEAHTG